MQELLVRFEPPDIYGVPPSKSVSAEEEGDTSALAAFANTLAAPSDTQVPSFPTEVQGSAQSKISPLPELTFPSAEVVNSAVEPQRTSLPAEGSQSMISPVSQLSSLRTSTLDSWKTPLASLTTDCTQSGTTPEPQLTSEILDSSQNKASPVHQLTALPVDLPGDGQTRPAPFQSLPPLNTFSK